MKIVIVLLALLLLVWLVLGSTRRRAKEVRGRDKADPSPAAPPAAQVEGMVACAHCGVHLPTSLALIGQGRAYCSAAHRDGGPRAP